LKAEVDQVAGHGDVVRMLADDIGNQRGEDLWRVRALAVPLPVEVAKQALGGEVREADLWQRADVRVGDLGQSEHMPGLADARRPVKPRSVIAEQEKRRGDPPVAEVQCGEPDVAPLAAPEESSEHWRTRVLAASAICRRRVSATGELRLLSRPCQRGTGRSRPRAAHAKHD
jgi:hypothetical protein